MLTTKMERQSCLANADRWRRQAQHVREHARRTYLRPQQREALLAEAEACDRQADWWHVGADDYAPTSSTAELAARNNRPSVEADLANNDPWPNASAPAGLPLKP